MQRYDKKSECANKIHFILPFAGFCESNFGGNVVAESEDTTKNPNTQAFLQKSGIAAAFFHLLQFLTRIIRLNRLRHYRAGRVAALVVLALRGNRSCHVAARQGGKATAGDNTCDSEKNGLSHSRPPDYGLVCSYAAFGTSVLRIERQ